MRSGRWSAIAGYVSVNYLGPHWSDTSQVPGTKALRTLMDGSMSGKLPGLVKPIDQQLTYQLYTYGI